MKVLYIGHTRESGGWTKASIGYIRSLVAVGVDVVVRPVKLDWSKKCEPPKDILDLESKSVEGVDCCIQHVLPHHMEYSGKFKKCVGLFVAETDNITYTSWPNKLALMDEVWVPNNEMTELLVGVPVPFRVVPHATDINKFDNIEPADIPGCRGKFVFYFIGENIRRKRITALLEAYNSEFEASDDVVLIIKSTNKDGLMNDNKFVLDKLRKFQKHKRYPDLILNTDRLSDEDILRLHKLGDCFVTATFGDSWCIPAFDAMLAGNILICPKIGGMADYYDRGDFWVDGHYDEVMGADPIFPDLHTSRENWYHIHIHSLREKMRDAYNTTLETRQLFGKSSIEAAKEYSYENIGKLMMEKLNA